MPYGYATADLDYRLLAPFRTTDPNGNRGEVAFDALGRVTKAAVMGKSGSTDGDTLDDPTIRYTYEVGRWQSTAGTAGQKPGFVKTEHREKHGTANTRWQTSYAFFDGGGGAALVKANAEPATPGGPARWIASGRTVVNNKGAPIKQYEPYFSADWDWEWEEALSNVGVTAVVTYDALGRALRTDLPNGTTSRVAFTPWRVEQWDPNDTVGDTGNLWAAARAPGAVPTPAPEDVTARTRALAHAGTPGVVHLDSLGRAFLAVADNGGGQSLRTKTVMDLEGQVAAVLDGMVLDAQGVPTGRPCATYRYAVDGQLLHELSIDSGAKHAFANVLGTTVRAWDAAGHVTRVEVDLLERMTHLWVKKGTSDEALRLRVLYGESYPTPEALNLRGRACLVLDGAGLVESASYDFQGHPLTTSRRLAATYTDEPDWTPAAGSGTPSALLAQAASLLETETFSKAFAYDALGRITSATQPDLSELRPTYSDGGLLEAIDAKIRGAATWTAFVVGIAYDAKGRRERIDYGNGTFTEYTYDPLSFRLTRLRTQRPSGGGGGSNVVLQDLFYFYDPVGNITTIRDDAHEDVFFAGQQVSPTQDFVYDAVYRLVSASGREHAGGVGDAQRDQNDLPLWNLPHPNDAQALRRYTEEYDYDPVGNIQQVTHMAVGSAVGSWTRHYRYGDGPFTGSSPPDPPVPANNRLHSTSLPGDAPGGPYRGAYVHDANGNMMAMPHLAEIAHTHADQMKRADLGGGGTAYYTYDASGERVRKVIQRLGTTREERIYLGGWELYRKRQGASGDVVLERETLHVMDDTRRIAMVETKTVDADAPGTLAVVPRTRYQYSNHLDSAHLECDETGLVISYEEYHPYGTPAYRSARSGVEVSDRRYRYTGKERDEETGFQYHSARYYAPWLGRWTSADPLGMVDGPCLYGYCDARPVQCSDPSGTATDEERAAAAEVSSAERNKAAGEGITFAALWTLGHLVISATGGESTANAPTSADDPRENALTYEEVAFNAAAMALLGTFAGKIISRGLLFARYSTTSPAKLPTTAPKPPAPKAPAAKPTLPPVAKKPAASPTPGGASTLAKTASGRKPGTAVVDSSVTKGPATKQRPTGQGMVAKRTGAKGHVGAARASGTRKQPLINLGGAKDNCTACVTAAVKNRLARKHVWTADDVERAFGSTRTSRQFSETDTLGYIERATGLTASTKHVAFMAESAPVGHYAIIAANKEGGHVVYGRVLASGKRYLYDPQTRVSPFTPPVGRLASGRRTQVANG